MRPRFSNFLGFIVDIISSLVFGVFGCWIFRPHMIFWWFFYIFATGMPPVSLLLPPSRSKIENTSGQS